MPDSTPLWISHRGSADGFDRRENSLLAFQAAVSAGFQALETDLRLTRDGEIVLSHDRDLKRLFGIGRRLEDLTLSELSRCGALGENGLLTFDKFVRSFGQCRWTLDIKPDRATQTLAALHRWCLRNRFLDIVERNSVFLYWSIRDEAVGQKLFPRARSYSQKPECWRAGLASAMGFLPKRLVQPGRTYALPPGFGPVRLLRKAIVKKFQLQGARVVAFLPKTERDIHDAIAAGVDEILVDAPHGPSGGDRAAQRDMSR